MKKLFLILISLFSLATIVSAQEDNDANEKIRDKMREYIQERMQLSKNEAERFTPIFIRYFREWRTTLREFRSDKLILQQKIVELRLRYRGEFKVIVGEQRSNQIYRHQDDFIKEIRKLNNERQNDRPILRRRVSLLRNGYR